MSSPERILIMSDTLTEAQAVTDAAVAGAAPAGPAPDAPAPAVAAAEPKPPAKPARKSSAKKTRSVILTLTVSGTAEGEWQADLINGANRLVVGQSIPAGAVAKAAKELHTDIADGIEQVLETVRGKHRSRMEELEAELARVKAQLAELSE